MQFLLGVLYNVLQENSHLQKLYQIESTAIFQNIDSALTLKYQTLKILFVIPVTEDQILYRVHSVHLNITIDHNSITLTVWVKYGNLITIHSRERHYTPLNQNIVIDAYKLEMFVLYVH